MGGEVIDRAGQRLQTVCQAVGVVLRPRLQGEDIGVQRQKYHPDSQQNVCFIQHTLTTCKGILYCELLKIFIKYNQILSNLDNIALILRYEPPLMARCLVIWSLMHVLMSVVVQCFCSPFVTILNQSETSFHKLVPLHRLSCCEKMVSVEKKSKGKVVSWE